MNNDEIRIAIAEACGWKISGDACTSPEGLRYEMLHWTMCVPNYAVDLNAMREAEKTLTDMQMAFYNTLLYDAVTNAPKLPYQIHGFLWHATALQKAESFLRAINKWKETVDTKNAA